MQPKAVAAFARSWTAMTPAFGMDAMPDVLAVATRDANAASEDTATVPSDRSARARATAATR
jgi:hypothetical protein